MQDLFFDRRTVMKGAAIVALAPGGALSAAPAPARYGMIGRMLAKPGQRDALIAVLLEASNDMAGCLAYLVAKDMADENAIWISEAWDSKASHDASLTLPAVRAAILRARPMIAGMDNDHEIEPVGGKGLAAA